MASALLVSQNEAYWGGGERKVYMRKAPALLVSQNEAYCGGGERKVYMRKAPAISASPNPSRSPVSHASSRNHNQIHAAAAGVGPSVSENSSSFGRWPHVSGGGGGTVAYNMAGLSRPELRELKRRLVTELEQVRAVASRIESRFGGGNGDLASGWDWTAGQTEKHLAPAMMKRCKQVLSKLMKQKGSIWFNAPVDVVGMGLHDYNQIVKIPMDLGTVKAKLGRSLYSSPLDFASDIRLTFNNAILYNPEGHEVHRKAGHLLALFERFFSPAYDKYEKQPREAGTGRQSARPPPPSIPVAPPSPPAPASYTKIPLQHQQQQRQQQLMAQCNVGRVMTGKQPKPKARDPVKRAMTIEEQQKLSVALQNLPAEKMELVISFVRRRDGVPVQNGDEIEIDFETMDNETLWDLDRFVCNYKKTMSKIRRQEAIATTGHQTTAPAAVHHPPGSAISDAGDKSPAGRRLNGDEDVDIGDELPSTHYPPVEIDRDIGGGGGCSGSSSHSSSSSDSSSDSDLSSASGDSVAAEDRFAAGG